MWKISCKMNAFYLEISPRRTGKTYRLIQHAYKNVLAGNNIYIISATQPSADNIKRDVVKYTQYNNLCDVDFSIMHSPTFRIITISNWISNHHIHIRNIPMNIYVDEFDMFTDKHKKFILDDIKYNDNYIYFSSSAYKKRSVKKIFGDTNNDLLLHLIKHNNYNYSSFPISDINTYLELSSKLHIFPNDYEELQFNNNFLCY